MSRSCRRPPRRCRHHRRGDVLPVGEGAHHFAGEIVKLIIGDAHFVYHIVHGLDVQLAGAFKAQALVLGLAVFDLGYEYHGNILAAA